MAANPSAQAARDEVARLLCAGWVERRLTPAQVAREINDYAIDPDEGVFHLLPHLVTAARMNVPGFR